jgi:HSP20 family protein
MDRLVLELWGGGGSRAAFRPAVDVHLSGDPAVLTVELEIAGIDPDEVEILVEGDVLVVRGTRRPSASERRAYQHAEIEWGRFERRIQLPERVDVARASADYRRGLLSISVPIAPTRPPSRVSISVRERPDS